MSSGRKREGGGEGERESRETTLSKTLGNRQVSGVDRWQHLVTMAFQDPTQPEAKREVSTACRYRYQRAEDKSMKFKKPRPLYIAKNLFLVLNL